MSKHYNNKKKLRVAMLAYSFYESDNRVRRYAETLSRRGDIVDILSLRRKGEKAYNELNGVRVFKIQERTRNEKGRFSYLFRILKFLLKSFYIITKKHLKKRYDLIHVHSVPDFEVFAALIPKLTGTKIILDIHDIVPELYASKFNVRENSIFFKALLFCERLSIGFSDHVIISNDLWKDKLCSRSIHPNKCTSIINYPDDEIFSKKTKKNLEKDRFIFLYPGTLNHHQGLDLAILALYRIRKQIDWVELHILGDGPARADLELMIIKLGLQQCVRISDPISLDMVAEVMESSDVGIIPKRNSPFGGEAFSTKSLEFMSLGVPIIISRTRIDQYYFDDSVVYFFEAGNVEAMASAMLSIASNTDLYNRYSQAGYKFAKEFRWAHKKSLYLDILKQFELVS